MQDKTISCDRCGSQARVAHAQPIYESILFRGAVTSFRHTLSEIFYAIDCPTCGPRTQCVAADVEFAEI